jgi:hypothetical protein
VIRHREQAISELGFGDSTRQALEELVKLALTRFGLGGIAAPPRELSQNLEPVPSHRRVLNLLGRFEAARRCLMGLFPSIQGE